MATFDGENLIITLDTPVDGVLTQSVQDDWYEEWKTWALDGNLRFPPAFFDSFGGNDLTPGIQAGAYFVFQNTLGWRIRAAEDDQTIYVAGNIAPADSTLPITVPTLGGYTVMYDGLQPITQNIDTIKQSLEFSLFDGGVWLDITSANSGTGSLIGTAVKPVNNLTDALIIKNREGLKKMYILESMTGADRIDSGSDISDMHIFGLSRSRTTIEVDTSTDSSGAVFANCTLYGTLDGQNIIKESNVGELNFFNGELERCGLFGTIYLDGGEEALMANCYTIDQDNPLIIDGGGSGQDLAMPGFDGLAILQNFTSGTEEIGIGLRAGRVILTNTVTASTVLISGIGSVVDSSGEYIQTGTWNTNVNVFNETINIHSIGHAAWGADMDEFTGDNTFGKRVKEDLLALDDYISLK